MNMIIAIDFDGTCVTHEYPKVGRDIGAVPVLKKIIERGDKLVLNTMRSGAELEDAKLWFQQNEIKLYGVNSTPGQKSWTKSPKVYAHMYIDDAALGCPTLIDENTGRPYVDWTEVEKLLEL